MHLNSGYPRGAESLMRRFVEVFDGAEYVVCPSGSCAAMVREHYPHLAQQTTDAGLARTVDDLVARVFELSEFLVDVVGVTDVGARLPRRVVLHRSCHTHRALRVVQQPLSLLAAVRDLDLVELDDAEVCCGFGGTFADEAERAVCSDAHREVGRH